MSSSDTLIVLPPSSSALAPRPRTAFISGHTDITQQEFETRYAPAINDALASGHHFVVGDAAGTDGYALSYLLAKGGPDIESRVTVYPSRPYNVPKFKDQGLKVAALAVEDGGSGSGVDEQIRGRDQVGSGRGEGIERRANPRARHLARDARMTRDSDYDILWARNEAEARLFYGDKYRPRVSATELNRLRRIEAVKEAVGGRENVSQS